MLTLNIDADTDSDPVAEPQYRSYDTESDQAWFARAFAVSCDIGTPEALEALHAATIAIVERLKRDGLSPEHVLVTLKESLTGVTGPSFHPSLDRDDKSLGVRGPESYRRVVAWFLDAYYASK